MTTQETKKTIKLAEAVANAFIYPEHGVMLGKTKISDTPESIVKTYDTNNGAEAKFFMDNFSDFLANKTVAVIKDLLKSEKDINNFYVQNSIKNMSRGLYTLSDQYFAKTLHTFKDSLAVACPTLAGTPGQLTADFKNELNKIFVNFTTAHTDVQPTAPVKEVKPVTTVKAAPAKSETDVPVTLVRTPTGDSMYHRGKEMAAKMMEIQQDFSHIYNQGISSGGQMFGYDFAEECAVIAVKKIAASKNPKDEIKAVTTQFINTVSQLNHSDFARSVNQFKTQLVDEVPSLTNRNGNTVFVEFQVVEAFTQAVSKLPNDKQNTVVQLLVSGVEKKATKKLKM